MSRADAYMLLMGKNIKPSPQRLAVMGYLLAHNTHPTIEEMYSALVKGMPTLSKTTVYNTLKLFVENGAAKMLTINEKTTCYDADTAPHAHFICERCGKVVDLYHDTEGIFPKTEYMHGNKITDMQVYYRGVCEECQNKEKRK